MSDQDNPVTGADGQFIITLDGAVIDVVDAVVSHSAEPILTSVVSKHLGVAGSSRDSEFEGWKGSTEISRTKSDVDVFLDAVMAAKKARTPKVINYSETTRYRDGTTATYVYPDITVMASKSSMKRGEASTRTFDWETGNDRIGPT